MTVLWWLLFFVSLFSISCSMPDFYDDDIRYRQYAPEIDTGLLNNDYDDISTQHLWIHSRSDGKNQLQNDANSPYGKDYFHEEPSVGTKIILENPDDRFDDY